MTTITREQFFRMLAGIDMPIYGDGGKSELIPDHIIRVFQHAIALEGKWIRFLSYDCSGKNANIPRIVHDITPFMESEGYLSYRYGSNSKDILFYSHSGESDSATAYPDTLVFVSGTTNRWFRIYSTNLERAVALKNKIKETWPSDIEYPVRLLHVSSRGDLTVSSRFVERNTTTSDVYYPFLGKPMDQLITDFLQSSSQVLLLLGPPGTGKSSFMREMICQSKMNPSIATRLDVMRHPGFFAYCAGMQFNLLFLEDADLFIETRENGNQSMSELLNESDGIVKQEKVKLVISTNLPSVNKVDPALLRPGRCFGVLEFRHLTPDEALAAARHHGNTEFDPTTQDRYTLAEALNPEMVHAASSPKKSFGFVS